jgi:hypothetical protein
MLGSTLAQPQREMRRLSDEPVLVANQLAD